MNPNPPSPDSSSGWLARSSIVAAAAAGLLQAGAFLTVVLLSRLLPPAELGAYRQVLIVQALPALLLALGVPEALLYALARATDDRQRGQVFAAGVAWMLLLLPVAGAATGGLVLVASRWLDSPALAGAFWHACWLGGLNVWILFAPALFLARRQPGRYLLLAGLQLGTGLALTAAFTVPSPSLSAALLASVLTAAQGALLTLLAFLPVCRPGTFAELGKDQLLPALRYGYPVALGGFLYTAGYQVDHLVASLMLPAADYGLYAGGAWQIPVARLAQHGQTVTLVPVLAAHHSALRHRAFWADWLRLARPAAIAGAVLFWGVFWSAPDILGLALGPGYTASAPVFRVYALLLPLRMMAVNLPLRAIGSPRAEIGAGLVLALTSLGVGLGLGNSLGLVGPALGMLAGMCAWVVYLLGATVWALKVSLSQLLPLRLLWATLAATGVTALGSALALAWLRSEGPLVRLGVFWGLYTALTYLLWSLGRRLLRAEPR